MVWVSGGGARWPPWPLGFGLPGLAPPPLLKVAGTVGRRASSDPWDRAQRFERCLYPLEAPGPPRQTNRPSSPFVEAAILNSFGVTLVVRASPGQNCVSNHRPLPLAAMLASVGTTAALLWQSCQLPSRLCWRQSALRQFCFGSPANSPPPPPPLSACRRQSAQRQPCFGSSANSLHGFAGACRHYGNSALAVLPTPLTCGAAPLTATKSYRRQSGIPLSAYVDVSRHYGICFGSLPTPLWGLR